MHRLSSSIRDLSTGLSDEEITKLVGGELPHWKKACDHPGTGLVLLNQRAFGKLPDELMLLGLAIKYAQIAGKDVCITSGIPRKMGSLTGDMPSLNRSAVVVVPKQPFLDWLHFVDPTSAKLTLADLVKDPTVYLLPLCEEDKDFDGYLIKAHAEMFEEELNGWWTKESDWPTNRTFKLFRGWFDYEFCSELIDLCGDALTEE